MSKISSNRKGRYYYETFKSINKEMLVFLTKQKNRHIENAHIKAVINLFLLQLEDDLFKHKSIKVNNFLEFNLRRMPAKRGRSYYTGEIVPTKAFNIMKISLDSKLNKKLMQRCDPKAYYEQDATDQSQESNGKEKDK